MRREQDEKTDVQLNEYVSLDKLQSFFLMAGAGSGKTRSLVSMLEYLRNEWSQNLKNTGKKIAVITFTNAASEEIKARISHDSSFHISTIHSFAWGMIKYFQKDIKECLMRYYEKKIAKSNDQIDKYQKKIKHIEKAEKFNYSPDINVTKWGYLNHSEVIYVMTEFLKNNHTFGEIMTQKHPVLLIDECQDTNKNLLTSFIQVEKEHDDFCLGLIGDMMQRVHNGGLEDLPNQVEHWGETPQKEMNWRCQKRIVDFINVLRKQTDNLQQYPNKDKNTGVLRTYIIEEKTSDSEVKNLENKIKENFRMTIDKEDDITTLILEHKMAAKRMGFSGMYSALNKNDTKNVISDGTGKEMKCIKEVILPFIQALQAPEEFELLRLFRKEKVFEHDKSVHKIKELRRKIDDICPKINENITLGEAVNNIKELEITELPDSFLYPDAKNSKTVNWQEAMKIELEEFKRYFIYKEEKSPYFTQQGSKGLEYNHVMVIMNDNEAGGNLFNFGKVYGTTSLSKTDTENKRVGKDNTIERTKRLLYVAASRAKESLALVIYTSEVDATREYLLENELVESCEIIKEVNL